MFFRFAASLILVVLVSMVGIGLEKQTLQMKRAVSRQYFQKDLLLEMHTRLRLSIQQLTAPSQLAADDADWRSPASLRQIPPDRWQMPRDNSANQATVRRETTAQPSQESSSSESGPMPSRLPLLRWEHPAGTRQ